MDSNIRLLLVFLPLIHHHFASHALAAAAGETDNCNTSSCGKLGRSTTSLYPFAISSACASSSLISSSFVLSNCSSSSLQPPSWDAFTQTIPSDYIRRKIIGPPAVMAVFSVDYSTFINVAWDSHLISSQTAYLPYKSACGTPVPLSNLPSAIPPSIDLSTFANSTLRFSTNNVFLLFNCTKSTSDNLDQLIHPLPPYQTAQADTTLCKLYRSHCTLMAEYYTTGQCVQMILYENMAMQFGLQHVMDDLACTHFQIFVTKNGTDDAAITEWSRAIIQLQWTVPDCWSCVENNRGSCVLDSRNHTFQKCTNCTYGVDISDPHRCNNLPLECDRTHIFGRIPICNHHFKVIVAVAVIVGTFLMLLALCCCWCNRRRGRPKKSIEMPTRFRRNSKWLPRQESSSGSSDSLEYLDLSGLSERPKEYSYCTIASATGSFSNIVGEGGFGVVFKGDLDEQEIAVKVLEVRSRQSRKQFLNEVAIIGRIHHVNVVRLLGFCEQHEELHDQMLVYEYVVNGSLDTWLFSKSSKLAEQGTSKMKELDWEQRYGIALGVARGLSYLHEECRHRIVHCDIKPQNILLDACMGPKISDFGLARLMSRDESRVVTLAKGTPGYIAPEFWVGGTIDLTTKADVYSYGMVLLELVSGRRNFALGCRRFPALAFEAAMCNNFESITDVRLLQAEVMPATEELRILMLQQVRTAIFVALWCIQEQPRNRPSMSEVVRYLEGVAAVSEQPPWPPIASSSSMPPRRPARRLDSMSSSSHLQLDLSQLSQGR